MAPYSKPSRHSGAVFSHALHLSSGFPSHFPLIGGGWWLFSVFSKALSQHNSMYYRVVCLYHIFSTSVRNLSDILPCVSCTSPLIDYKLHTYCLISNKSPQVSSVLSTTVAYRLSKASLLLPRAFSLFSGASYRLFPNHLPSLWVQPAAMPHPRKKFYLNIQKWITGNGNFPRKSWEYHTAYSKGGGGVWRP
jgi:hypothetical protein